MKALPITTTFTNSVLKKAIQLKIPSYSNRRMLGLWAFAYIIFHIVNYVAIDQFFD